VILQAADISISDSELLLKKGICWGLNEFPILSKTNDNYSVNNESLDVFNVKIENLRADSKYYIRSFYTTEKDTVYGNQVVFETLNYILFNPDIQYGIVIDIDGNAYKTVTIGEQTWMAENLRSTHFQNGDELPNLTKEEFWSGVNEGNSTAGYCSFKDDESYNEVLGLYYNWDVVNDERNIAPKGWRVPNKEDWDQLAKYSGYALREKTSAHWKLKFEKSNNTTGFTAIAGGKRHNDFSGEGDYAYFFTTSIDQNNFPISVYIGSELSFFWQWDNSFRGYNIRCIKE